MAGRRRRSEKDKGRKGRRGGEGVGRSEKAEQQGSREAQEDSRAI